MISVLWPSLVLAASNRNVVYQGRILRPDGDPVNSGVLAFTLKVYSPAPSSCLLYSETQNINMTGSLGTFSLNLGEGTATGGVAQGSLASIWTNAGILSGLTCASGSSYSPTASDDRLLAVSFNDAGTNVSLAPMSIRSVPYALQAEQLSGYGIMNVAKISGAGSANAMTGNQFDFLTNLAAPASAGAVPCAAGEILKYNGTAWACATDATGGAMGDADYTVKGVVKFDTDAATSGLNVVAGVVSVNVGTGANQILKLDGTAKIPAVDGSQITNLNPSNLSAAVPVAKGGTGLAALGTSNQVLGVNNAGTAAEYKTVTAGTGISVVHGANAITINATGGSGTVTSVGVSVPGYMSSTGGPVTTSGSITLDFASQAAKKIFASPNGAAGVPSFRSINISDVQSSVAGAFLVGGSCTAGQALTYDSLNDNMTCSAIVAGVSNASTLNNGKVWIGDAGNKAQEVTLSGDATVTNAGVVALKATGTAGTYYKVTTDAQGRVTSGAALTLGDITTALGYTPLNKAGDSMTGALGLNAVAADPAGLVLADKGKVWYNTTSNQVKYWDGAAAQPLGVAGSGLSSLGGQIGSTQTFAAGSAGNSPAINSAGDVHTLNVPLASSAGTVTSGTISNADYVAFSGKLGSGLATNNIFVGSAGGVATGVAMSGDATIVASGAVTLKNTGTAGTYKSVTTDAQGRVTAGTNPTTLGGFGITDAVQNTGGLPSASAGTFAARPAAGTAGRLYVATDTFQMFRDNGATWDQLNVNASDLSAGTLPAARLPAFTGDATSSAGSSALTLKNTGTAGTYYKVTTDAQGRVTSGSNLVSGDVTTALGYTPLNKAGDSMTGALGLNAVAADPAGLVLADKGKVWFNTTSGQVKYWDGAAAQALGVSGSGLTSLGGQVGSTQTFAAGSAGNSPAINSAGDVHTLNVPLASSAGTVTSGTISNADYVAFNAKLGTGTSFSGDVSGNYNSMSVDKIKGTGVNITALTTGNFLQYNGTNWVNTNLAASDIPSLDTAKITTGVLPIARGGTNNGSLGVTAGGAVYADGTKLMTTAAGTSGQPLLSAGAGAPSYGNLAVGAGGTGATSFAADKLIVSNGTGSALQAVNCGLNQVMSFTGGGAITCADISSIFAGYVNGGNSFAGNATIGTNDNFTLGFKTNNTTKMTIDTAGNIGVGTAGPVDPVSIGTAVNASATHASVNLSNTALVGGSANGTYLGANPAAFTGNFIDMQVGGTSKFKVDNTGKVYGDGSGLSNVSGAISGLTAGKIPKAGSGTTIVDSIITEASSALSVAANSASTGLAVTQSGAGKAATFMGGNVGIGTTTPGAKLHVVGGVEINNHTSPGIIMSTSSADSTSVLTGVYPANDVYTFGYSNAGELISGNFDSLNGIFKGTASSGVWGQFVGNTYNPLNPTAQAAGSAGMFVYNGSKVNLYASGLPANVFWGGLSEFKAWNSAPTMTLNRFNGTPAASTDANVGEVLGNIQFNVGATIGSQIISTREAGANGTGFPATLEFWTTPVAGVPTQQMTIKASGNVGIGSTSPAAKLEIDGASGSTLKIVDGNQGAGKVLTSDAAGQASWQTPAAGGGALSSITAATAVNTIDNLLNAQTWNWSTATTENPLSISANALTTGSLLNLTTSSAAINSTNGLLNVANTSATTTGTVARIQSNSTAGSGLTVLANGNVGIGTAAPTSRLHIPWLTGDTAGTVSIGSSNAGNNRTALTLTSASGKAIDANTDTGIGIYSYSNSNSGVKGQSYTGTGVYGYSSGTGVYGEADAGSGIGMYAVNSGGANGIALKATSLNGYSGLFQTSNTAGTNAKATLVAKLNTSQTANLFEVQDTAGTVLTAITSAGSIGIGNSAPAAKLEVNGASGSTLKIVDGNQGAGKVLTSDGAGQASWQTPAGGGGGALSAITAATAVNTIDNLLNAQTWNWSTATTQSPMSISANALTTGSLLNLTTSSASINSTNGLLNVANTSATTTGTLARFQANSTAGSGMTLLANGNMGIGTASPTSRLHVPWLTGDTTATATFGSSNASNNRTAIIATSYSSKGIEGYSTTAHAIYGETAAANRAGVSGYSGTNSSLGVQGISDGTNGQGVHGEATFGGGKGVYGLGGAYGVQGEGNGGGSSGVYGLGSLVAGSIGITGSGQGGPSGVFQTLNVAGTNTYATLISKLNTSQTANLFEAQNAAGTVLTAITSTGSIGIGNASPAAKLEINGASGSTLKIVDGNQGAGKVLTSDGAGQASWQTPAGGGSSQWTTTASDIYYNTGKVGIGTTAPGSLLTVKSSGNATVERIENSSGNSVVSLGVENLGSGVLTVNGSTGTPVVTMRTDNALGPFVGIAAQNIDVADGAGNEYGAGLTVYVPSTVGQGNGIVFTNNTGYRGAAVTSYTASNSLWAIQGLNFKTNSGSGGLLTRMTIAETGNVGIGTTAPNTALDVSGALSVRGMAAPATSVAGQGRIYFDSTANKFKVSENNGAYTDLVGGGGGGGSPAGADTQIQFNNSGAFGASSNFVWNNTSGALTVTGDINYTGVLTDISDRRKKKDVKTLDVEDMAERINKIRAVSFRMIADPKQQVELGVIAQELEEVFPDLVKTANDEMHTKSVNYIGLIGPLVAANQKLRSDNDAMKSQIASLVAKNEAIEKKVQSLDQQAPRTPASVEPQVPGVSQNLINMILFGMILGLGFIAWRRGGPRVNR